MKSISDEQYDMWEEQFRQEINPSSSSSFSSDPSSSPICSSRSSNRASGSAAKSPPEGNADETIYFDDSDDDMLLEAADHFETTKATYTNNTLCDITNTKRTTNKTISLDNDSDDDSPIKRPSRSGHRNRQLSSSSLSSCESEIITSKRSVARNQARRSIIIEDSEEDSGDDDDGEDDEEEDSEEDYEEEEKRNFNIITHWTGERDLDRQIRQNEAAMRVMKNRHRRKANPFVNDEAMDAFDSVECFDDDPDNNIDTQGMIHDESLMDFVSDNHDYGEASGHHLRSLMSQDNSPFKMPARFQRRAPRDDIEILSDTDEEDRLDEEYDEEEDEFESSFVDDEIQYVREKTPKKVIQTQEMRLRSNRLLDRRHRAQKTPERPPKDKRRKRIIIDESP